MLWLRRALISVVACVGLLVGVHAVAGAAPRPAIGFKATVLGWTSWYGSYDMGSLGTGFCIDHGSRAPDPALGYIPTTLGQPASVRSSLAWLYGTNGEAARTSRVVAAAVMLAGHDIVGARYPQGRLDLARMTSRNLAGFAGNEWTVLSTARRLRADAVARSNLVGPLRLSVSLGGQREVIAEVRDAEGRAVGGIPITVTGTRATAVVPDLNLKVFRPTQNVAQRVAIPATVTLTGDAPEPPPTTSTSTTSTSTTSTTAASTTTTTALPTTTSSSTSTTASAPTSTSTSTSTSSTSTTRLAAPVVTAAPTPPPPAPIEEPQAPAPSPEPVKETERLPTTGTRAEPIALAGGVFALVGAGLIAAGGSRKRARRGT